MCSKGESVMFCMGGMSVLSCMGGIVLCSIEDCVKWKGQQHIVVLQNPNLTTVRKDQKPFFINDRYFDSKSMFVF